MAADGQSFERFILTQGRLIRNLIGRMAPRLRPEDVDDLTQKIAIRLWEKSESILLGRLQYRLSGFVRNCLFEHLRKESGGMLSTLPCPVHEPPAEQVSQEEALIREEDRIRLLKAVESLPMELRGAWWLRKVEGWSYERIAGEMDASKSTIHDRVRHAGCLLHERLTLGMIEGTVLETDNPVAGANAAVRGATISASQEMRTDHRGVFRFVLLPVGDYVVSVWVQGRERTAARINVTAGLNAISIRA